MKSTTPPGRSRETTVKGSQPLHEPDSREGTKVGSLRLRTGANPGWSVTNDTRTSARFPGADDAVGVSPPTYEADRRSGGHWFVQLPRRRTMAQAAAWIPSTVVVGAATAQTMGAGARALRAPLVGP